MERYVDINSPLGCHVVLAILNGHCKLAHALASAQRLDWIAHALCIHATVMPPFPNGRSSIQRPYLDQTVTFSIQVTVQNSKDADLY